MQSTPSANSALFLHPSRSLTAGLWASTSCPSFRKKTRSSLSMLSISVRQPGLSESSKAMPSPPRSKLSVHHIGLSDVLFAAKLMRTTPLDVCLIGIQPKSLDLGLDMTDEIRVKLDDIIGLALQKLKEWNVECVSQSPQKSSR